MALACPHEGCGRAFAYEDGAAFGVHVRECEALSPAARAAATAAAAEVAAAPVLPVGVFQQEHNIATNANLRQHQKDTHAMLEKYWAADAKQVTSVLVTACTGSGKSGTIAMAPLAVPGCRRVLVVVPNDTVKDVLLRALSKNDYPTAFLKAYGVFKQIGKRVPEYPHVSVLQPGVLDAEKLIAACLKADIVLATASYLGYKRANVAQRLTAFEKYKANHEEPLFDLIVFDEAHHTPADMWTAVRGSIAVEGKTKILHTTATPFRTDDQTIDFDKEGPTVSLIDGLQARERFVKDICFMEAAEDNLEEAELARQQGSKYLLPDDDALVLMRAIARQLGLSRSNGMPHKALIVIGTQPNESGDNYGDELVKLSSQSNRKVSIIGDDNLARPIRIAAFHSGLSLAQRKVLITRFQRTDLFNPSTLDALITVDTLGEGYDLPIVSVVGILRPYMSMPPFYQFIGRATRVIGANAIGASEAFKPVLMDNVALIITHERLKQRRWFEVLCDYMRSAKSFDTSSDMAIGLVVGEDADYQADLNAHYARMMEEAAAAELAASAINTLATAERVTPAATGGLLDSSTTDAKDDKIKDIRMNCMVLAPLKSAGGEESRDKLEKMLEMCWNDTSGWNTRLEQVKKIAFSFEFEHQDLTKVYKKEELLARLKKLKVATAKKGPRPSQTDSHGGGDAAKALFPDGPAPKKPRAG